MAGGTSGGKGGPIVGINITPMVDVMLVLLVILMVSANYVVQKQIKIELPKAASGEQGSAAAKTPTTIAVRKDGALFVDAKPQSLAELTALLKAQAAKDPEGTLIITADRDAAHGKVVEVVDLARTSGLRKFAITVEGKQ
jgi:biopolymer transport protein ExbD